MNLACPACRNVLMAKEAGPVACPYCRTEFTAEELDPLAAITTGPPPVPRRKRRERAPDRTGLYVSVAGVAIALLALCGLAIAFWPNGGITAGVKSLVNPDEAAVQAWMAENSPSPTYELVKIVSAESIPRQHISDPKLIDFHGPFDVPAHRHIVFRWRYNGDGGWKIKNDDICINAKTKAVMLMDPWGRLAPEKPQ